MSDLNFSDTIKPKSDQLNADDLLVGPITVTITGVKRGNAEQPISVILSDGFQPFKPCKSMRRVLIGAWGDDGKHWIGRTMTLYADPSVKYGGVKVGGIRISHLSHIKGELSFALTVTRGKREPYSVLPIKGDEARVKQYPDPVFAEKLPAMRAAIAAGKMTPDQVFAQCEKTGRLTAVQKSAITAPEAEPTTEAEVY
jgi:hypothetical protein